MILQGREGGELHMWPALRPQTVPSYGAVEQSPSTARGQAEQTTLSRARELEGQSSWELKGSGWGVRLPSFKSWLVQLLAM